MTSTEPEWDKDERGLALALLEIEADKCPGCGGQMIETTDPESEGRWQVGLPTRCHLCTALAIAQEPYSGDKVKHPHALLYSATRK